MSSENQAASTHQPASDAPDAQASRAREKKRARYQAFVRRAAQAVDQDRIKAHRRYADLVGAEAFALLQQDREAVERALDAVDPRWRRCAVYLLKEHWKAGEEFADRCERMAWEDPDDEVREFALSVLTGHYHFGTKDQRLAQRLWHGWFAPRARLLPCATGPILGCSGFKGEWPRRKAILHALASPRK